MTRLGTLRVTAPPPSPPQNSPPQSATPPQLCLPPSTSTPPQQPPTPIRQPPLSKNLRWTAVALVSKLSKELERPSSAIADEVALAASHDMRRRFPEKDVAPVERNTRRRVYDALKVMVAVGCIQRHGKDLRWIGVDHLRYLKANNGPNIRVSLCESRRRIGRKKAMLTDMRRTINAFDNLHSRHYREHQWRNQQSKPPVTIRRIPFPMLVVNAKRPEVAYSHDRKRASVTTQAPFKVYSETDLVTMLAHRAALKKPKITKKRRPARGTLATSSSYHKKSASSPSAPTFNIIHVSCPAPQQNKSPERKQSDATAEDSGLNTRQYSDVSTQDTSVKKDDSITNGNETIKRPAASMDYPTRPNAQYDKTEDKLEPRKVTQVKREPEEASTTDVEESTAELPQQMLIYNVSTTAGPSARTERPDTESVEPSAVGTQGERDVSTGPLICDEELGIPPLDDGDSSTPESDDDRMIGWKAGEDSEHDFERVFTAPLFHEV